MAMGAAAWESKRWTLLASMVVLAGLWATIWWITGGCEPDRKPSDPTAPDAGATLEVLQAMKDRDIQELSLRVAWFYARRGRLPADVDELGGGQNVPAWPPVPTATARGEPLTYRPTGPRTFELLRGRPPGPDGRGKTLALPMEVPDNLPTDMGPDAFRPWWELHCFRQMSERLREAFKHLGSG